MPGASIFCRGNDSDLAKLRDIQSRDDATIELAVSSGRGYVYRGLYIPSHFFEVIDKMVKEGYEYSLQNDQMVGISRYILSPDIVCTKLEGNITKDNCRP